MPLIPILQALFTSLVAKVLISLGLTWVTYEAIGKAFDVLRDQVINSLQGLPADTYNILMMAGFGEAISIILGAVAFKLSFFKLGKLMAVNKMIGG